jgi:hypothetical protein
MSRCVPPVLRGRVMMAGSVVVLSLLSWAAGSHAQQGQFPPAPRNTIPTLEALPHGSMPPGDFQGWCGLTDKALVRVGAGIEIFDGGVKASPLTFPTRSTLNCGDDGQKLIFDDEEAGLVYEVDISGGIVTRTLATYNKELAHEISFSPDLKSVAKYQPLNLAPGAVNLKIVELSGPGRRAIGRVRWSRDSSELFGVSAPEGQAKRVFVEIVNAQNQKIGSGALPAGFFLRDGWFANSQALYLYLIPSHDEFGSGSIFKCRIENWKCEQIATNVLEASAGGDGILGMVRAIGKYSNDGDRETLPPRYVLEIRNGTSQVVARQTFKSGERYHVHLELAPSGNKAIFTWTRNLGCSEEKREMDMCKDGIMVDLSGLK